MRHSLVGLADVLRLMPLAGEALPHWVAALDAQRTADHRATDTKPGTVLHPADPPQPAAPTVPATPSRVQVQRQPLTAPQYAPMRAEPWVPLAELSPPAEPSTAQAAQAPDYQALDPRPAPAVGLAPVSYWWPALKRQRANRRHGIDTAQWARQLSVARWSHHPPKRQTQGQWAHLCVLVDCDLPMVPYLGDFLALIHETQRMALAQRLTVLKVFGPPHSGQLPATADALLLLSDLGAASAAPQRTAQAWLHALAPAIRHRIPVFAWVPAHPSRIAAALCSSLRVMAWHEGSRFQPLRAQEGLQPDQPVRKPDGQAWQAWLTRLAFVLDADPATLRRLRRLCPEGAQHPEWEAMLWAGEQAGVVAGETVVQLLPAVAAQLRRGLQHLSDAQQQALWHSISTQHRHRPRSTLMAECLLLASHASPALCQREQAAIGQAQDWFRAFLTAAEKTGDAHAAYIEDALYRMGQDATLGQQQESLMARLGALGGAKPQGVSATAWLRASGLHRQQKPPVQAAWAMVWRDAGGRNSFAPATPQPHEMPHLGVLSPHRAWLHASWASGMDAHASRAAAQDQLLLADEAGLHRWHMEPISRQPWQELLGRDRWGIFCEWQIKKITVRLRYIPTGTFLMGSPEGVGDRDEHPQHPVTLTQGFWLADTPCTQALWQAVMGQNPSHFKAGADAPQRPVENVSFNDVTDFLNKLKALLPEGTEPALPTEAQWEYACRAGTQTAYWWGDEPDDNRANWNGNNQGTTPVNRYPPNPWGLFDMHGNVWEWCADDRREYTGEPEANPTGSVDSEARVVRGGSWFDHPDDARSACRSRRPGGYRDPTLGFRFFLRSSSPGPEGAFF